MISFRDISYQEKKETPSPRSMDLASPERPFDNIINFRDVGKTMNGYLGRTVMKEGVLFRSARPDDASERDIKRLSEELRVATVIDLRSESEHNLAAEKARRRGQDQDQGQGEDQDQSHGQNQADMHLVHIPGASRVPISLTGKSFERSLLWRLDWMNFFKVISLSATGYRHDAVKLVLQSVLAPRGLTGLALDTLDASTVEIKEVFGVLAGYYPSTDEDENEWYYDSVSQEKETETTPPKPNPDDTGVVNVYPVLIHCTQGKDRTGLIILLVLLLVLEEEEENSKGTPSTDGNVDGEDRDENRDTGAKMQAINNDYTRSEQELVTEKEERLQELRYMGIPDSFLLCPEEFTSVVRGHLRERYGGVTGYLGYIGVTAQMRVSVRKFLL